MQEKIENNTKTIDRIYEYITYLGQSLNKLSIELGLSNSYFSKMLKNKGSVGSDIIENILRIHPDLNADWLITGRGSMLKEKQMEDKVATNATNTSNTQIEHISTGTKTENNALLYNMYSDLQKKDAKIESLNKELTELKLINQKQEAYIEKLVRVLEHYENIGTIQDTNNMQEDNVGDVPFVESSLLTPLPSARANVRIGKRRKQ
ncbi:hypothetical protein [Bacteroides thetaiotaomicron]|uniref:hypothetical protein n=1 Tax=Bacteroides thetaiotaomicron TaxID=818 RepID=UPI000E4AD907|nr:hypothetical protein [Bacteroides thetaiotaomicron]RHJ68464.1 hypothetical protein DW108_14355 [Bacteroides thetaiotaomicron]